MNQTLFSRGTEIDCDQLIALSALANQVPLHKQRRILGQQSGGHLSRVRGRGMEFAEVRGYQAGDDIRAMDWRVTARTGSPHIKLFREEKERPVIIACDLRANMWFGTRKALKAVVAADVTALLSWSAFYNGDKVGGLLFNDVKELNHRPNNSRSHLLRWLTHLSELGKSSYGNAESRLCEMLQHTQRVAKPGSAIYIVSDWLGLNDEGLKTLLQISHHCDITAIRITDPLEATLPPQAITLTDGQQSRQLRINPMMREQYQQAFINQYHALQQHFNQLKIPLIPISTDDHLLDRLRSGLGIAAAHSNTTTIKNSEQSSSRVDGND